VKFFDAALLSTAIGLTCSSVFLFASDYPGSFVPAAATAPLETTAPRSKDFIAIVIHGACRAQEPGSKDSRAHFRVPREDASGFVAIEATPRWKEQLTSEHTRNRTVNRRSIAVWVDLAARDAGPSPAQAAALALLVERLRSTYGIAGDLVFTHADVDVDVTCGAVFKR
jgi:hypothetical protein